MDLNFWGFSDETVIGGIFADDLQQIGTVAAAESGNCWRTEKTANKYLI